MRVWVVSETTLLVAEVDLTEVFRAISSVFISLGIFHKLLVLVRIVIDKALAQAVIRIHIQRILRLPVCIIRLLHWIAASVFIRVLIPVVLLTEREVSICEVVWL